MGQALYRGNTTVNGVSGVHYISADLADVSVRSIESSVYASAYPGINGTFFSGATLVGIAAKQGGVQVAPNGASNANATYDRSTLVSYNYGGANCGVSLLKRISEFPYGLSSINWAIGGIGLYLNDTFSGDTEEKRRQAYIDKCVAVEHAQSVNSFTDSAKINRTAIGYKNSTKKVVMLYLQSGSAWDCRNVLKALGCDTGILLDSGTSSQMKAKDSSFNVIKVNSKTNSVYSMVAVEPSSWA
ncbi:Predicted protein [Paenibacillus sp. OK060]|uniref:phosphodiester glycosidase family protein n=1 Tax=Paenibacillus sp. OK060 TaxID=1881034 RepID=UPI00088426E9|nr:phosphodiester glycosidase family protein [Paenibacillus sp. OK060]SDM15645.1 Predicted protein [Paenibacillus sp. OK060]